MLLKQPGFTVVAIITLALGIGANTAIFSVVNGLLLRPLPYHDAGRLAIIWTHSPGANVAQDWPSPGQYTAIKSRTTAFEEIAIAQGGSANLTGQSVPERVGAVFASSALFSLLDAKPALGRTFLAEDDVPGNAPAAILSHAFWQRRFGGDPNAIGQTLTVDGDNYNIVGIMPAGFSLSYEVMPTVGSAPQSDVLLSLPMNAEAQNAQGDENYNVLARLKPDVTIAQAQAELDAVVRSLEEQYPDRYPASRRFGFSVTSLLDQVVGDVRPALLVLLASVGCVLLIACANVANLLLARAAAREKEIAIRTAIGAARGRLVRQLLTESVLLAIVGGAFGLLIAVWGLAGLRWLSPSQIPRLQNIAIDGRVLAFTFAVVLLTGVLFGLAPALRASRVNLGATLKEGGRSLAGSGNHRLRNLLVIAEVALSLVLLIGAGLLIRSFGRVQRVEPGFVAQNLLSLRISVAGTTYEKQPRRKSFYDQLWQQISEIPGVESAGGVSILPLSGGNSWGSISIEGYSPEAGQSMIQADGRVATIGYFETMKTPLISGRFFTDQDNAESTKVVIIDDNMARTYWPGDNPLGKRLKWGSLDNQKSPWMTIVGVVASVKQYALDGDSRVAFYSPHLQAQAGTMYVTARTSSEPLAVAGAITRAARAMDPNVPVYDVKTMEQRLTESLARRRFAMVALGMFAFVAMVLAAVGIYGVMSYSVTQRTREIGIRMALGSPAKGVLKLVVGQGMLLAGAGVAAGFAGAIATTRLMASLLFGISATDPVTFGAIGLLLAGVALVACYLPARRATKVDPMVALRYE